MEFNETEVLSQLYLRHFGVAPDQILPLAKAGSDRNNYRLLGAKGSAIGTTNHDGKENETFIAFSRHFKSKGVAVPEIYEVSEDRLAYLQEDLGGVSLYQIVTGNPWNKETEEIYQNVLIQLLNLQLDGAENFDFNACYPVQSFDKTSMFWDLNSFKYYFARPARVLFHEPSLQRDFHRLTDYLLDEKLRFFMMRDCQSRNIMLKDWKPFFIDYQGGRKGALQYDVASLLWQAGAKIPMEAREKLLDFYIAELQKRIPSVNTKEFKDRYYGFLLIRMLQVLSAYGFRGLFEGRSHFIQSIPPALENIKWFMEHIALKVELPELYKMLRQLIESDQFKPKIIDGSQKPLVVSVNSFSFKRGIPEDKSGNGGGFIFDCRGLHNPGRYQPYKTITGKDAPVIQFLETQSRIQEFLEHVYKVVDISMEDYLQRDFQHLQINFGCTGGQHRSVYCAEAMKKYLESKYKVKVELHHIEQEIKAAQA
jgi:aminoglycoside/choline kinase family phosphotransferase